MRARAALAATIALTSALAASPASGSAEQLAGVRSATAGFHRVAAAESAGYEKFLLCFDSPDGGMGQHYADFAAIDGTAEATHPEVLVYEPTGGRMRLVAVEYVIPQAAWAGSEPPRLFGESFHRNDTLGIWALHAWVWRHNPDGMHADFNPKVGPC